MSLDSTNGNLPDLYEASITELQRGMETGTFTSVDLVKGYIKRIKEVNTEGPALRAVLEINPKALEQAVALDDERRSQGSRGVLHGIPILVKDNIATLHEEGMNTTAGSYALMGSVVPRDATVVAKLRAAGAIILAKASLGEWGNFRGDIPSGFCGRGGQATNPYYPNANPGGSSTGSAIGTAIGLAAGSLGTETDGSIVTPSSLCNLVGLKPTVGLVSRAGVIPVSSNQDSVGPICRSVVDVSIILSAIAGPDPLDPVTLSQAEHNIKDYRLALDKTGLKGIRVGVPRLFEKSPLANDAITIAFNEALEMMRELGAIIVDPAEFPNGMELLENLRPRELPLLETDFRADLNAYLADLVDIPSGTRTLTDLIEFNKTHADLELIPPYYDDQSRFIRADTLNKDGNYYATLAEIRKATRADGIDATLQKFDLDCIVLPTNGFASPIPAVAGYPIITVPLGFQPQDMELAPDSAKPTHVNALGLPFGLSFIGTAFTEFKLITFAYAYEQKTQVRLKRLPYAEAIPRTQLKDVIGREN